MQIIKRDQASDSEEVVIPLMLDGTYLSCSGRDVTVKEFCYLRTVNLTAAV